MNPFPAIGRAFLGLGKGLLVALRFAEKHGLTDDLVQQAVALVASAQVNATLTDNAARREWVVSRLQTKAHLSESVARLTVELAIQQYKHRIAA